MTQPTSEMVRIAWSEIMLGSAYSETIVEVLSRTDATDAQARAAYEAAERHART